MYPMHKVQLRIVYAYSLLCNLSFKYNRVLSGRTFNTTVQCVYFNNCRPFVTHTNVVARRAAGVVCIMCRQGIWNFDFLSKNFFFPFAYFCSIDFDCDSSIGRRWSLLLVSMCLRERLHFVVLKYCTVLQCSTRKKELKNG